MLKLTNFNPKSLQNSLKRPLGIVCIVSSLLTIICNVLNYTSPSPLNNWGLWIFFVLSLVSFTLLSWNTHKTRELNPEASKSYFSDKKFWVIIALIIAIYFISHFWNWGTAPWNGNGVFDDAAWDINYSKIYIFSGQPFQPAFFDTVGYISREVGFHYYITIFFKLFGYNLLTFTLSLMLLGLITILFTALIVKQLTKSNVLMFLSAIVINFLPSYFVQTFIGHRYVIIPPLLAMATFFLLKGFADRRKFFLWLSALFSALAFDSGIMGKQFLYALGLAAGIYLLLHFVRRIFFKKRFLNKWQIQLGLYYFIGLLIASMPLLIYIAFNYNDYSLREKNLMTEFFTDLQLGWAGLEPRFASLGEMFFAPQAGMRQFTPDYVPIPFYYLFLSLLGAFRLIKQKHYFLILVILIPIFANLVSSPYDFRILITLPFFAVTAVMGLAEIGKILMLLFKVLIPKLRLKFSFYMSSLLVFVSLLPTLQPAIYYLDGLSRDPLSVWHLNQNITAESRFIRDIVAGIPNPNPKIRTNELNRLPGSDAPYDSLICQTSSFAVLHTFLQDYGSKKIMDFCGQSPMSVQSREEIYQNNLRSIKDYPIGQKDLLVFWEVETKTEQIIPLFKQLSDSTNFRTWEFQSEGRTFNFVGLLIQNRDIATFKEQVALLPQELP